MKMATYMSIGLCLGLIIGIALDSSKKDNE